MSKNKAWNHMNSSMNDTIKFFIKYFRDRFYELWSMIPLWFCVTVSRASHYHNPRRNENYLLFGRTSPRSAKQELVLISYRYV